MTDGQNIIYHYIQKTLLADVESDDFTKELIERLIIDLSIWFPPNIYKRIPVLLPYVIRDSSCRRKKINQLKDEWGHANSNGFLRDDNTLIKGIIKPFLVKGNRVKDYNNKKLANGFVASHIWRKLKNKKVLASSYEATNSFIPNLVWLPKQISKLTDREGSYAQNLLKTLSYKVYWENDVSGFSQTIWDELDNPSIPIKTKFDVRNLNYFIIPEKWLKQKTTKVLNEIDDIKTVIRNRELANKKVKCSSYLPGLLENLDENYQQNFLSWLESNEIEIKENTTPKL